jgi:HD-GYP domain-containing protein (c-di-GMP phosphodiesterase class II)
MLGVGVVHNRGLLDGWQEMATPRGKVEYLHRAVRQRYPNIDRIAVATYDGECDMLKTYVDSTVDGSPLRHYQVRLADVPSLFSLKEQKRSRVISDISTLQHGESYHSQQIRGHGFLASYTAPMFLEQRFLGFVFFNSRQKDAFNDKNLAYLEMVAHLLTMIIGAGVQQVETLRGALKTATYFSHHRDPETGEHLERMARFSRLIAQELAKERGYPDEFVEDIFWFAPLHDIGKIAIPDEILLKPGKLSETEFERMKLHTLKGREIIHNMLSNFSISNDSNVTMMSNIAMYHHENIDGSGYPEGLAGEAIPLEARIVAVADVFDALASKRPYKEAWSNEEAFAELQKLTAWKLDADCVEALYRNRDNVERIQATFRDKVNFPLV